MTFEYEIKWPSNYKKLPDRYGVVWFDDRMWVWDKLKDEAIITACSRFWLRRYILANYCRK